MTRKSSIDVSLSIDSMNTQRAFLASVIAAVLIPVYGIITRIAQCGDGAWYKLLIRLVIIEAVQLGYALVIKGFVNKNLSSMYDKIYISYYAVTILSMIVLSEYDIRVFGSSIIYVFVCLFFVFVPVLTDKMRLIFLVVQTVEMLAMLLISQAYIRTATDVCLMHICTVFISNYQHVLLFKRQRMTSRLKEKTNSSEHDSLTGILNRRGLERRASAIWPYCERNKISVGVIALDIDFFKKYNDSFGHPKGDECLCLVANALKQSARRSTDVITRTGGEEFLIFIQDVNESDLPALALKIRRNIEKKAIPHAYKMVSPYITVSMGVSSGIPGGSVSFNSLYEEADKALYIAKKNGRNCIVYDKYIYGRLRNGMGQPILSR